MEILIGFIIAVIVGMTGMGGGSLMAPVLILFLNMPAAEAVGTSLIFTTVSKLFAMPLYIVRKEVDYRVLRRLVLGGLPGVVLGSVVISKMAKANLQDYVLAFVGSTIAVMGLFNLIRLFRGHDERNVRERHSLLPLATFPIGFEVGFSSAGAGALGSILMLNTTRLTAAKVVGTDMLFGFALASVGGGLHLAFGEVNSGMVAKLLTGAVAGAMLGSWLGTRMPSRPFRVGLTSFLVFLGGQLAWKGLTGLAH